MRRTLISISAAVAAAALLVGASALPAQAAPSGPSPSLVGKPIKKDLFGMHVFNAQNGVWPTIPFGSLRLWDNETTWSSIERSNNQFDWTKLDAAVANAQSHGVTDILLVLAGTPSWSTDDPASGGLAGVLPGAAGMPRNMADWDDWVTQVASRYKGRITAYQPWNEANLSTFSTGSAQQMADLTKHAYDIIKRIDPQATVVAPSTGTRLGGPFKKFYPAYLAALKQYGWPVDVWSAHTYPASLGTPVDRDALVSLYESVLAAAGAPSKPIWDTENNFGLAGPGPQNPDQDITGTKAADWTARTYLDALRLGISRVYWYAWGPENDLVGIQMNSGSPAANAYKTLEQWIVGDTFNGCSTKGQLVTCTFTGSASGPSQIVYTDNARPVTVKKGAFTEVCSLEGTCTPIKGKSIRVSSPVRMSK